MSLTRTTQITVGAGGSALPLGARTSIATVCLSGTLGDKLDAIAYAGFDGVEIFEPDLIAAPGRPAELARATADRGLSIDLYQPFRDLDSQDPDRFRRNLIRLERKFSVMDDLGCDLLLVCSSPLASAACDDGLLTEQLATAAQLAAARGKRLAYEALAWGHHVNDYRHAAAIVAAVDNPALGTCLDSFHILSRGADPSGIADLPGDSIFFLQLADAPRMAMDLLQWSRHHRCLPGQGNFDLVSFTDHVLAAGYRGPWSLEVFSDVFRHADPVRTASDAHRSLRYLAELVGAGHPESSETAVSQGVGASGEERRPVTGGVVSIRVAAGPTSAPQLGEVLGPLGFDLSGVDSSTGLQLYRDAELAVVVDPTVGTVWTSPGAPTDMPTIAQIGLRSAEPGAWAARAAKFDVPVASIAAPGPSSRPEAAVEVVRLDVTDSLAIDLRPALSAGSWQRHFDLVPREPAAVASLYTGVDHIGIGMGPADWEAAMLLLRSVFGMSVEEGLDVPDAVGTMRSQALTSATESGEPIRLVASLVPSRLDGHGPLRRRGGLTHAAFACDDIVATARACRSRGLITLPIPENYYDDLRARFDLGADRIDALRRYDILYDADEIGGEFFHFFTPTIADDLFFEVVCRRGGYRGYGEVNSPVRVAAALAFDA
ncbi:sugar phosphate isomerase/epimerase and 4-hydroxyphenylpyruvate domain-containing protein [Gordonia oryzae]|uniref:3-dehydroshikimate dehydratase n=1 Tax=Gordonia oryzae TaxID=2487349 RepID=A0A3N4GG45_9ACTN|nr:sugar phosphate isomerase/epimerase and 4-hydroxyphenylpyruvate domain-containing protein [Gordonia oryzae]RPA61145.1 sugar phosphate isomerase/epimerase and 4-hydroxyphenylpyruvate domain-containing protein [Gordonia oryzae]